ncbi:cytochrome c peroxidase [Fulvivirgaceae bacterium BMA12]|uniref:Cytochrome c peroxidase n=1 Tax=Agaribacillus aureus TaxID=3051825 RepID=A0ABT8L5X4_9BACT|nr:cytochrome c peroxidase [Fulvivirgaceae bacterium BMA12]
MISKTKKYLVYGWVLFLFWSCSDDDAASPKDIYAFEKPAHFPDATYTFENNPITKEGFELGKKLFFDPILSRDKSVSCNNCHQQSRAFADSPLHPTSIGVDNRVGIRNAPPLANLAFMQEFFWDGGVTHLDFVPINAIESDVEMDETLVNVVKKLNEHDEYPLLFEKAFGVKEITSPFMLHAISQFTAMMVSAGSRYDKYVLEGTALSNEEMAGMKLFEKKCATCHSGELFSDFSYRNNGLNDSFGDLGRGRITEDEADHGKFRVPSLRNAELTAPYMHNARFLTLEEVLDHYDGGMVDSPTLDPLFKDGDQVVGISLTTEEKTSIIAFIKTLTDRDFIAEPKFRNND